MELKKEFVKLPKEMVYDTYLSIVYDCKDYDNISRSQMLDAIVKEYSQEGFLDAICTGKELTFLEYAQGKKLNKEDLKTYEWEMKELNKKCIFSLVDFTIFEEQKKNVIDALSMYKKTKKEKELLDKTIVFMISLIKINGCMLTKAFTSVVQGITGIQEKDINGLIASPLLHFYCEFSYHYLDSFQQEEEQISYRAYYEILEELEGARKKYGIAGNLPIDIRDNFDIFYYGFPIRNVKVKKMVDEVGKLINKDFIFRMIDEARVLNNRHGLDYLMEKELLSIVNDALDEMPCAAMNGFTPKAYLKEKEEEIVLNEKFIVVPQNNAHLSKNAADLYYKLYFALLDYTNKKYAINKNIGKIYKQEGLNVNDLFPIDEYLWEHKEIIDDFIEQNPNKFNKEELEIIDGFKTAVRSDRFVVVGFEREYTQVLSEDGKLYMVKGIRTDLDKVMNPRDLPKIIRTTLLMFEGNIIFNSFLAPMDIVFGNDMKNAILKDYKSAIKYYHL